MGDGWANVMCPEGWFSCSRRWPGLALWSRLRSSRSSPVHARWASFCRSELPFEAWVVLLRDREV
jgi:hypothetical protein